MSTMKKRNRKKTDPEYYVDRAGKVRWRRRAENGEIYGASHQGFETLAGAKKNFARNQEPK